MNLSRKTRNAVRAYGADACLTALRMHKAGEGASTIALTGPATIRTTRQADAAIAAGLELKAADDAVNKVFVKAFFGVFRA